MILTAKTIYLHTRMSLLCFILHGTSAALCHIPSSVLTVGLGQYLQVCAPSLGRETHIQSRLFGASGLWLGRQLEGVGRG